MKKLNFTSPLFILLCLVSNVFAQNFNRVDVTDNNSLIGFFNVRYGYNAGNAMTFSGISNNYNSSNAFFGTYAGNNSNGSTNNQNLANTFMGFSAGNANSTGSFNTFTGYTSGFYNKTASSNVFMGASAGQGNNTTYTAGGSNTGIGTSALAVLTTGSNNVAVGYSAMIGSTANPVTGTYNIALGSSAGANLSSGDYNILIGNLAGNSTSATNLTGNRNIAIGQEVGYKLSNANDNILIGTRSGYNLTTGGNNLFIGYQSGFSQTSTVANANNTFIGNSAGSSNLIGTDNTFMGQSAGFNYKSNGNTIIGSNAGIGTNLNPAGDFNTFVGNSAGASSYGISNTLFGAFAGFGISSGNNNIFVGRSTGTTISSGSNNVFIGTYASTLGVNSATISNSIAIGYNAKSLRNNTISLGDTSANMQVGIGTNWPTQRLSIKGNFSFVAYNDGMFYKNKRFLFQDEQENIALGTNHDEDFTGKGNMLLGVGAKVHGERFTVNGEEINNSTAIGNGAVVSVSNGLVLGNQDIQVGIGTSAPTARLEVASGKDGESGLLFTNLKQNTTSKFLTVNQLGQVVLEKPRTQINSVEDWSDKVFEQNYQLKSLTEVEQFIKTNKHLPNIPSAQEMTEKGIENEKLSAKLLEKIEELTLYLIEMKKENKSLQERLNHLEKK